MYISRNLCIGSIRTNLFRITFNHTYAYYCSTCVSFANIGISTSAVIYVYVVKLHVQLCFVENSIKNLSTFETLQLKVYVN